jgi:hypothetical protein
MESTTAAVLDDSMRLIVLCNPHGDRCFSHPEKYTAKAIGTLHSQFTNRRYSWPQKTMLLSREPAVLEKVKHVAEIPARVAGLRTATGGSVTTGSVALGALVRKTGRFFSEAGMSRSNTNTPINHGV